jgi:hypothetical protein
MSNVIKAFLKIVTNYQANIQNVTNGNNRANNMGEGLEHYIKEMFADVSANDSQERRLEIFQETYSYQGNKNNPPDLILKNSDAIEIKKLESHATAIALNSSYPKAKLYADSTMITSACRTCETWSEKEMLYAIGNVPKDTNQLKSLWLVYGDCFCADKEIYERIKDTISSGITSIPDVEFTQTNELGKVKKVDPLGVTDLRIRGMWHIDNPSKILNYLYKHDETKAFQMVCLMKKAKYDSLPLKDRQMIENLNHTNVSMRDVKIKNPNNPVQLMDGVLLVLTV